MSEAEWEYAARGATTTAYPWGASATHDHANYGADDCCSGSASGLDKWMNISPVGSFPPNGFGLHDMHGNVLQWVQDCFASSYSGLPTDGSAYQEAIQLKTDVPFPNMIGTNSCSYRIVRGGDWGDPPSMFRSAFRNFGPGPGATLHDYRSGLSHRQNAGLASHFFFRGGIVSTQKSRLKALLRYGRQRRNDDVPVELVFGSEDSSGWRSATPGVQAVRLVFDQPQ
jgi:hypothetical protein